MNKKPSTKIRDVAIDGGRQMGAEVRDSDPDGVVTVHSINQTQRRVDALHYVGAITDEQHLAATKFRDIWERGRLVAGTKAAKLARQGTGIDATASRFWKRHMKTMEFLGIGKAHILQAIVLHDEAPAFLAARHAEPLKRMESALNSLVDWGVRGHLDLDPDESMT